VGSVGAGGFEPARVGRVGGESVASLGMAFEIPVTSDSLFLFPNTAEAIVHLFISLVHLIPKP
jgi:hypothetical protein